MSTGAIEDLERLRSVDRAAVRDGLERFLRDQPRTTSRSRIKRLRGIEQPQYRLRIGDIRVFYDVEPGQVEVLAIVKKADAEQRLREWSA